MLRKILSKTKSGLRFRREPILNERPSKFLPPYLPAQPLASQLLPDHHLLAGIACTRYWHHERRIDVDGMKPPGIPHWLRRFDWLVGWEHGWADPSAFPRGVYCHPNSVHGLLRFLEANHSQGGQDAFIVVGGEDTLLSQQNPNIIKRLKAFFRTVYYEAYDLENADVEVMPIGLTEFYIRGVEDDVRRAMAVSEEKEKLVLSAFGQFWPHLNATIDDRKAAIDFSNRSAFVSCGPFGRSEYFAQLALHKFMICPLGNGVQAPKILEGFLTRCIPIMTDSPVARRLVAKGAPILIVESWNKVSAGHLEEVYPEFKKMVDDFFSTASSLDSYWRFSFQG